MRLDHGIASAGKPAATGALERAIASLDPLARRVVVELLAGATHATICSRLDQPHEVVTGARERALRRLIEQLGGRRNTQQDTLNGGGSQSWSLCDFGKRRRIV